MAIKRQDKWSLANIDFSALTYAGVYWFMVTDNYEADGSRMIYEEYEWNIDGRDEMSFNWFNNSSPETHGNRCAICGHAICKFAMLVDLKTNEAITIGMDCFSTYEGSSEATGAMVRLGREIERRRLVDAANKFFAANGLIEAMELRSKHHILQDLFSKCVKYGNLSEKQIAFALKLANEVSERETVKANEPPASPAPTGRCTVVGTLLGFKSVENDFGSTLKMLVQADEGFKVWVTCPTSLRADRGDKVQFTATITPSNDDPCFAFGSRPSKASNVTPEMSAV
jgi:hypothetical protein